MSDNETDAGFTRDDVKRLDDALDIYGGYSDTEREAWWTFVESLRSRIAALLPPPPS